MKAIFCDKCGRPALIDGGLKISAVRQIVMDEPKQYDFQFDLCDECAEHYITEIQNAMHDRLTKGDGEQ